MNNMHQEIFVKLKNDTTSLMCLLDLSSREHSRLKMNSIHLESMQKSNNCITYNKITYGDKVKSTGGNEKMLNLHRMSHGHVIITAFKHECVNAFKSTIFIYRINYLLN